MKKVAFLFVLTLVLAACAPSARDSGMAGGTRTQTQEDTSQDMSDSMTGGDMDMEDGMATGGSDGLSVEMDDMTGGADMSMDMTGGAGMNMDDGMSMDDMTGGSDMGMSTDAQAGSDTEAPTGSLEAAASPAGPFYNDRPDGISDIGDERVVRVLPGGSFFLRVQYSDPSGVSSVDISLRNSSFQGELPSGPFTIDEAASTSTCDDQLATAPTELNCTIKVDVASDAQNISDSGEFAYVFRAQVEDAAGNSDTDNDRGYVALR